MQIGKVVGTVVSTKKDDKLEGLKLQVVKYVDSKGEATGGMVVAADAVGAGPGELILITTGSSARLTPVTKDKPVDAIIVAIIDSIEVNGKNDYVKN